jgi:hypothetical protein
MKKRKIPYKCPVCNGTCVVLGKLCPACEHGIVWGDETEEETSTVEQASKEVKGLPEIPYLPYWPPIYPYEIKDLYPWSGIIYRDDTVVPNFGF